MGCEGHKEREIDRGREREISKKRCMDTVSSNDYVDEYKMD